MTVMPIEIPNRSGLRIAKDLVLQVDAVTQTFAAIARKGAGKTYFATKLAELFLGAGAQAVAIDVVGNWYGLRLSADGKHSGLPIYVFGGERGDIPLTPESGRMVAAIVVEKRISVVLDISSFRKGERVRFAHEFAEEFFHRKKTQRSPVHLFLEEAQKLVPQQPGPDERRMLGAFEDIVRLGRNYGIGCTLVSQRPQSVNKEVLSQVECLVTLQINGVHERKAIDAWVSEHGLDRGLLGELPGLAIGEAFIWSPSWLRTFKRIRIEPKETFDASATPTVGQKIIAPAELSPVDLKSLSEDMASTIERAKADDPKELRRKIAQLETELRKKPVIAEIHPERENEIRKEAVRCVHEQYAPVLEDLSVAVTAMVAALHSGQEALERGRQISAFVDVITEPNRIPAPVKVDRLAPPPQRSVSKTPPAADLAGASGLRRMLIALAQRPQGMSAKQLGVRAVISSKSGTFGTYLGKLRTNEWIEGDRSHLRITAAGEKALGSYDPLPTGPALLDHWLSELGDSGAGRMLRHLYLKYPKTLTAEELGDAAGISSGSGTFGTYLGKLRSLELIEGSRGALRASEEFFE